LFKSFFHNTTFNVDPCTVHGSPVLSPGLCRVLPEPEHSFPNFFLVCASVSLFLFFAPLPPSASLLITTFPIGRLASRVPVSTVMSFDQLRLRSTQSLDLPPNRIFCYSSHSSLVPSLSLFFGVRHVRATPFQVLNSGPNFPPVRSRAGWPIPVFFVPSRVFFAFFTSFKRRDLASSYRCFLGLPLADKNARSQPSPPPPPKAPSEAAPPLPAALGADSGIRVTIF